VVVRGKNNGHAGGIAHWSGAQRSGAHRSAQSSGERSSGGQWSSVDDSSLPGTTTPLIERLMDIGIDGAGPFSSAQRMADSAGKEHPDVDSALEAMVRSHLRLAAANGFVTSLGGFAALPIALPANVLGFYLVATRMVAGIATTRGHDIGQAEVRSAILLALVGADADDLLRKASDAGGGHLVNLAAQRLPGPALMAVRKGIAFRLITRVGKRSMTRFGKVVPVAGALLGAGLDAYLLKRIADHARHEFPLMTRTIS
jgi:hypothetical protein